MEHEDNFDTQDSCPADSESEKFSEFEEEEVNKMVESDEIREAKDDTEERTALEAGGCVQVCLPLTLYSRYQNNCY